MRFLGVALLWLWFLAGCTATEEVADQTVEVEITTGPDATENPAEPETPTETEPPTTEPSPGPCSEEAAAGIETTISSQIQAFGADDFELAHSFASETFRARVSVEEFIFIIQSSYGPLIETSELAFSNCVTDSEETVGIIDARFIQGVNDVYALRYLISNGAAGWKVEGASNLAVVGEGA